MRRAGVVAFHIMDKSVDTMRFHACQLPGEARDDFFLFLVMHLFRMKNDLAQKWVKVKKLRNII